jgi:hypothetical protein
MRERDAMLDHRRTHQKARLLQQDEVLARYALVIGTRERKPSGNCADVMRPFASIPATRRWDCLHSVR